VVLSLDEALGEDGGVHGHGWKRVSTVAGAAWHECPTPTESAHAQRGTHTRTCIGHDPALRRSSLALPVSANAALGPSKSTYIFVAQKAHDLIVALGRQHAECCRDVHHEMAAV